MNNIEDCSVKIENIIIAENIFDSNIHTLKNKMVHTVLYRVMIDHIMIPKKLL